MRCHYKNSKTHDKQQARGKSICASIKPTGANGLWYRKIKKQNMPNFLWWSAKAGNRGCGISLSFHAHITCSHNPCKWSCNIPAFHSTLLFLFSSISPCLHSSSQILKLFHFLHFISSRNYTIYLFFNFFYW